MDILSEISLGNYTDKNVIVCTKCNVSYLGEKKMEFIIVPTNDILNFLSKYSV